MTPRGDAVAVVLAAGRGVRMGADKALLDLGGRTAVERVVDACRRGGVDRVVVVRAADAAPLPAAVADTVEVAILDHTAEMLDSVRAGIAAAGDAGAYLVFPVDHALAGHEVVATVLAQLRGCARIGLPLWQDRPGHPIAFDGRLRAEVEDAATHTLRDVIARDPTRVRAVPLGSPWVRRDLDTPDDLAAARRALSAPDHDVLQLMRAHRSRRAFRDQPLAPGLLDELVDAARHASTSSFLQAYAVVAVEDAARKAQVAALCADQAHIHQAPVFLAVCADLFKLERACARHGQELATDGLELFLQASVDAALLGQNLLLGAEACGLGGCMVGAARNHPEELAQLLGLPDPCYVVFGMVLGHPADDPEPRGRMPLDGILHRERYDAARIDTVLDGADQAMRAWAERVNARGGHGDQPVNTSKGWTDRMARLWARRAAGTTARGSYTDRRLLAAVRARGFGVSE